MQFYQHFPSTKIPNSMVFMKNHHQFPDVMARPAPAPASLGACRYLQIFPGMDLDCRILPWSVSTAPGDLVKKDPPESRENSIAAPRLYPTSMNCCGLSRARGRGSTAEFHLRSWMSCGSRVAENADTACLWVFLIMLSLDLAIATKHNQCYPNEYYNSPTWNVGSF